LLSSSTKIALGAKFSRVCGVLI